jgi:hypothetical protein
VWGPPVSLTVQTEAPRPRRASLDSGGRHLAHAHGFTAAVPACCFRPPFSPPRRHHSPPLAALRGAHCRSSSSLLLSFMHHLCSPRRLPLPLLHPTPTPSSAQATPLSRSTVLKRCFYLESAAVKSPQSHPMPCIISANGASSTAAISSHHSPSISPPRGHRRPNPLRPASRRRRPRVQTIAVVPLRLTHAIVDSTPGELPSSRPFPNQCTKPSRSSSRRSPTGLVAGEPELAGCHRPASSARLLCS